MDRLAARLSKDCVDVHSAAVVARCVFFRGQLSIQEISGDASLWHAVDVAYPADSELSEQCEHAGQTCARHDFSVGQIVMPRCSQDAADASHVEGVQTRKLTREPGENLKISLANNTKLFL